MEVTGDQTGTPQDRVRRPTVAVEDPDAVADRPARGMHHHLPGQVANEADIVIPEHDLYRGPLREEASEEAEHDGSQGRRGAHDRVLYIARNHQPFGSVLVEQLLKAVPEELGRPFRWTSGPVETPPEPEMEIGDDDRPAVARAGTPQQESGDVRYRL
jgi:hypothetical protein